MKKKENEKQFRELSDEELEKVNGGAGIGIWVMVACKGDYEGCSAGEIYKYVDGKCQCVPKPNTDLGAR